MTAFGIPCLRVTSTFRVREKEEEKCTDEGDTKITHGYSVCACTYMHMHL